MAATKYTEAQKRAAVDGAHKLMAGDQPLSVNDAAHAVAISYGVGSTTVRDWARAIGRPLGESAQAEAKRRLAAARKARELAGDYNRESRLALTNRAYEVVESALEWVARNLDASKLRDVVWAMGSLHIQRRQLEAEMVGLSPSFTEEGESATKSAGELSAAILARLTERQAPPDPGVGLVAAQARPVAYQEPQPEPSAEETGDALSPAERALSARSPRMGGSVDTRPQTPGEPRPVAGAW